MNIITKHPVNNLGYNFIDSSLYSQRKKMNIIFAISKTVMELITANYQVPKKKYSYAMAIHLMTGVKFLFQKHLILHW